MAGLLAPARVVADPREGGGVPAGPVVVGTAVVGRDGGTVGVPAPYIHSPVSWTAPGLSVMPRTVVTWPPVSVSRTVNGPAPAPDGATQ